MTRIEEVEGKNCREYLKQLNKQFNDLRKYVNSVINSRKIIHLQLSNRIEQLEKRGKE